MSLIKKILLTSFDPFAAATENQSMKVADELSKILNKDYKIETLVIPTVFDHSSDVIKQKILEMDGVDLVISLGEGDHRLRFEMQALNLDHCVKSGDNRGDFRDNKKIIESGPEQIDITWSLKETFHAELQSLIRTGQDLVLDEINLSSSAGNFVCNNICYHMGLWSQQNKTPFLFFHVIQHRHDESLKNPVDQAQKIQRFLQDYIF